ncbi:MAG: hypothetical protein ACRDQ5_13725, partial [Sciscionella sp.]
TAVLAATPPEMAGTAGGLSSFGRTFAATLGPAVAALAWTMAGGGDSGFRTGVLALIVMMVPGFVVMQAVRGRRSDTRGTVAFEQVEQ